jgi:hypothetical protein
MQYELDRKDAKKNNLMVFIKLSRLAVPTGNEPSERKCFLNTICCSDLFVSAIVYCPFWYVKQHSVNTSKSRQMSTNVQTSGRLVGTNPKVSFGCCIGFLDGIRIGR